MFLRRFPSPSHCCIYIFLGINFYSRSIVTADSQQQPLDLGHYYKSLSTFLRLTNHTRGHHSLSKRDLWVFIRARAALALRQQLAPRPRLIHVIAATAKSQHSSGSITTIIKDHRAQEHGEPQQRRQTSAHQDHVPVRHHLRHSSLHACIMDFVYFVTDVMIIEYFGA